MSSPPERSWILATPIASSAKALEANMPAAAVAAVLCKNRLRLSVIAVALLTLPSRDQVFLQNRRAHGVFRIDHVAEPHASGLAQQHVGVDLVEAVFGAQPARQFAIGDAGGVLQRTRAADRHDDVFVLKPRPGKTPALDDVDLQGHGGALLDRNARQFAVALRRVAIADVEKPALAAHREIKDR